jgi:hypothetical protein
VSDRKAAEDRYIEQTQAMFAYRRAQTEASRNRTQPSTPSRVGVLAGDTSRT